MTGLLLLPSVTAFLAACEPSTVQVPAPPSNLLNIKEVTTSTIHLPPATKHQPFTPAKVVPPFDRPTADSLSTRQPAPDPGLISMQSVPGATIASWDTDPSLAQYGSPDSASRGLSAGAFSTSIALDVPSGPGGLTPPLALQYNSAAVSDQHSARAPAGWMGEGWSLDLGAISWSEHSQATTPANIQSPTFQSQWHWTDPYGVSTDLIPPTNSTALYADDSSNKVAPSPILWHAATENYAQIYSINGTNALPDGHTPPCFQVFLANGFEEEYGCTLDALQWYATSGTSCQSQCKAQYYVANWLLDMIQDPLGNTIRVTYQHLPNDIDVEPQTITWDSPTEGMPLHQVVFNAGTTAVRLTNTPANCNPNVSLRCDDPQDLSGSGGLAAPKLMGAYVLNGIAVQTWVSGSWSTIRSYQLSYEQSGPQTITDPVTNQAMSVAGYLDLTKVQEFGTDGTTSYPATTLAYATQTEYYEDSTYQPLNHTNCGPNWNTGNGHCFLWSQSYAGNSRYLTTIDTGQGLHQVLTWQNARSNTHGTPSGGSPADPFYCDSHQAGYPCNAADDQAWSRIVLHEFDATTWVLLYKSGPPKTYGVTKQTVYSYQVAYPLAAQDCSDCVAGMYWGDQTDTDYLDYYNERFMGFAQVSTSQSDGSLQIYHFYSTEGIGVYDAAKVTNCRPGSTGTATCQESAWWEVGNVAHGRAFLVEEYADDGTTLLEQTSDVASPVCPPAGVAPTPQLKSHGTFGPWDGNLVAELDHGNPIAVCDVQHGAMNSYLVEGSATDVQTNRSFLYDKLGRIVQSETQDFTSSLLEQASTTTTTTYVWENDLDITPNGWQEGAYEIDTPAQIAVDDSSGHRVSCERWQYDYNPYQTGQITDHIIIDGNLYTNGTQLVTADNRFTNCGAAPSYTPSGMLQTTYDYTGQTAGNGLGNGELEGIRTPSLNNGETGQTACTTPDSADSVCFGYDGTPTYTYQVADVTSDNLSTTTTFDGSAAYGFGSWPKATTDANNQTTTTLYDPLGRVTGTIQPGDTAASPTATTTYANFCPATGPAAPCVEIDTTQRLNATTTTTTRNFYDGQGHLVETRSPISSGQDSVQFTIYDAMGHQVFRSIAYLVAAYTGAPGMAAYSVPDVKQPGSSTKFEGLGRLSSNTDPQSHLTTYLYATVAGVGSDTSHYEQIIERDANNHESDTLINGLGRVIYARTYTGNSPNTWKVYATTTYYYNAAGQLQTRIDPVYRQTVYTFDGAGRVIGLSDPDLGYSQYGYDANGDLIKVKGPVATAYMSYDTLGRGTSVGPNANGTAPIATWVYDTAPNGKGRLGAEKFANAGAVGGASGTYTYAYDARGNVTNWTMTLQSNPANAGKYAFTFGYNDANQQTSVVYPDGDTVTTTLSAQDQLSSVTENLNDNATVLVSSVGFSGYGGGAGLPTSAAVGNGGSTWTFTYDSLLQPIETQVTSGKSVWYDQKRTFDAVGNAQTVDTTLPTGTDNQMFCYDELGRLLVATTSATTPCGNQQTGTLTGADYAQSFSYDTNNRLTSGPLGSYTYDPNNTHDAATAIGTKYTAAYDAAGNMTCRSVISVLPCDGSPTSTTMSYDILNRLHGWQDEPQKPTQTAQFSYDGEGNRVQMISTNLQSNTTTTTRYIGPYEQISTTVTTTGKTTNTTKYYDAGILTAVNANGALSYLVQDYLGSVNEVISGAGSTTTVSGMRLFTAYGGSRYTSGTMPTDFGFAGQRTDPTGLVYMNARYYDPTAGQFTTADTVLGPNRFDYVDGNPSTLMDPTGQAPPEDLAGGGWTTSFNSAAEQAAELAAAAEAAEAEASELSKIADAASRAFAVAPAAGREAAYQRLVQATSRYLQATNKAADLKAAANAAQAAAKAAEAANVAARLGWGARLLKAISGLFETIGEVPLIFWDVAKPPRFRENYGLTSTAPTDLGIGTQPVSMPSTDLQTQAPDQDGIPTAEDQEPPAASASAPGASSGGSPVEQTVTPPDISGPWGPIQMGPPAPAAPAPAPAPLPPPDAPPAPSDPGDAGFPCC